MASPPQFLHLSIISLLPLPQRFTNRQDLLSEDGLYPLQQVVPLSLDKCPHPFLQTITTIHPFAKPNVVVRQDPVPVT